MPPIIPTRTKVFSLIQDGVLDAADLVSEIGVQEQWVHDIIEDELRRERRRRMIGGYYCPAAVAFINSLESNAL